MNYKNLVAVTIWSMVISTASATTVSENFEGFSPNTLIGDPILIGVSPDLAILEGNAFAGAIGQGVLYHSGVRSWMVLENSVGTVAFQDNNASSVAFFIKTHPTADGDTVVTAFDDLDQIIDAPILIAAGFNDPSDPLGKGFTKVMLSGDIDHITIANHASNIMNAFDDLTYVTVPEPNVMGLLGFGVYGWRCRRNKRSPKG